MQILALDGSPLTLFWEPGHAPPLTGNPLKDLYDYTGVGHLHLLCSTSYIIASLYAVLRSGTICLVPELSSGTRKVGECSRGGFCMAIVPLSMSRIPMLVSVAWENFAFVILHSTFTNNIATILHISPVLFF